jgi:AbrB family looped-hinge helix DNA binding protein
MVGRMKAEVDAKGRIVIPFEARQELEIEPGAEVEFEIKRVVHKKSFVQVAKGAIKGAGDAVKLLHKESPFR